MFAFVLAFIAIGLWYARETDYFLKDFWPWWFSSASLCCFWYAAKPESYWAMMSSGVLTMVGTASRVVTIWVNMAHDVYPSNAKAFWLGTGIWALATVACFKSWEGFARVTARNTGSDERTGR